jgi:hypothetical protein
MTKDASQVFAEKDTEKARQLKEEQEQAGENEIQLPVLGIDVLLLTVIYKLLFQFCLSFSFNNNY